MKQTNNIKKMLLWVALLLPSLLALKPEVAEATHFRYGHLTWQPLTGNNVRFTLVNAFRREDEEYPGSAGDGYVAVGDIIEEHIGETTFNFGDGNQTDVLAYKVISIDVANNWFLAQALEPNSTTKTTIDHLYSSPNNGGLPWQAEINSCCRTSTEINNPDGQYRVSTLVNLATANSSPVSSLPAIVNLVQGPASQFIVPGADPDAGTTLTFRLASPSEAGIGFAQPNDGSPLTIDFLSGVATWNTTAAQVGEYYSCQVIIEDRRGSSTAPVITRVAVDFLIYIILPDPPCDNNIAPAFVAPSPACGAVFNVNEGQPLTFTVTASDVDDTEITLNSAGVPSGATLTPGLPSTGNPVSTVFNWTPGFGQANAYVVTFTATDSCGAQVLCSYTINVIAIPCTLSFGCTNCSVVHPTCATSCDGKLTVHPIGSGQYQYLWSNGGTTATIQNLCANTYTVTVTDQVTGCVGTKTYTIKKGPVSATITLTKVSCFGACDGAISVAGKGGNGAPFTYLWNNGATTNNITGLCANVSYTVTITDKKGCTGTFVRKVLQPALLKQTISKVNNTGCAPNNCNGSANAKPTGGTQPYSYLWSNGQSTKIAVGLCAGTYTVTVTDTKGCTSVGSVTITGNGICHPRFEDANSADVKQITAYPNPFSDVLNINVTTDENLTITVKDITGRVVSVYTNINKSFVIDGGLKNGIYFLDVQNQSGSYKQVLKVIRAN